MAKQSLIIPNISCGHCVAAIQGELNELNGIIQVSGDAGDKSITVEWEVPMTLEKIKAVLEEINYPVA